jgi:hypothetical protein
MRRLSISFDNDWEEHAVPLNDGIINRYVRFGYAKQQAGLKQSVPLREIIGTRMAMRAAKVERLKDEVSFWRDCIKGYVSKQTEMIIASTTNWDEKGYLWYSAGPHQFKHKDRILMFDLTDDKAQMVQVVASTRTAVTTPDGVHFVAFKPLRGEKARRLTDDRWKKLKAALGITRKEDVRARHKLSEKRWSLAGEVLRPAR